MIEIQNLTKCFPARGGELAAVDHLTLSVAPGQIFGLLGPNGAGKTTTLRMLTGLLRPTSGTASINGLVLGRDDQAIRARVGLLTEAPGLYDTMSAEKNLTLFGRLHGLADAGPRAHRSLKRLALWDRRLEPVGAFSTGMKQKLAIARAALHDPDVLFLDEPTSGLDPDEARQAREFILDLKADGRTIVLCTHNLEEADRLCDRIGIFKHKLIVADTTVNLRRRLFGREQMFRLRRMERSWVIAVGELDFVQQARAAGNVLYVRLEHPEEHNPLIVRRLVELNAELQYIGEVTHSLEEIYLQLLNEADGPGN